MPVTDGPRSMRFKRSAAFNVVGTVLPMIAAVVAVPVMLTGLGTAKMGLFTLLMGIFGFAGIIDLGLGRALTREVARLQGASEDPVGIAEVVRYALVRVFLLGLAAAIIISGFSGEISDFVVRQDGSLVDHARAAMHAVAVLLPVSLVSGAILGVLEGLRRFDFANTVRAPIGTFGYLAPAAASWVTNDLAFALWSMVAVRSVGLFGGLFFVAAELPLFSRSSEPLPKSGLWRFTGWLSVSNVVGPLMVYADRYYLAMLFPPSVIARYTVPMDALFRATSFPGAVLGVLFPEIANSKSSESQSTDRVFRQAGVAYLVFWMTPMLFASACLEPLLSAWLRNDISVQSVDVARWVLAGVAMNGVALLPFTVIQAVGRSDVTAKLHVAELFIYVVMLVAFVTWFGLLGAAIAWVLRVALDGVALLACLGRVRQVSWKIAVRYGATILVLGAAIVGIGELAGWLRIAGVFVFIALLVSLMPWRIEMAADSGRKNEHA